MEKKIFYRNAFNASVLGRFITFIERALLTMLLLGCLVVIMMKYFLVADNPQKEIIYRITGGLITFFSIIAGIISSTERASSSLTSRYIVPNQKVVTWYKEKELKRLKQKINDNINDIEAYKKANVEMMLRIEKIKHF